MSAIGDTESVSCRLNTKGDSRPRDLLDRPLVAAEEAFPALGPDRPLWLVSNRSKARAKQMLLTLIEM